MPAEAAAGGKPGPASVAASPRDVVSLSSTSLLADDDVDGVMNERGNVLGSYLHGLFDDGQLFAAIAAHIRKEKGIDTETQAPMTLDEYREREFDRIADIVRASVDMDAIYRIVRGEV